MRSKRLLDTCKKALCYLFLSAGALVMVLPFVWMLTSSLMTTAEMFHFPPRWLPDTPLWGNYVEVVEAMPFLRFTFNTLFISILGTLGTLLSCAVGGYVFARMEFPGKGIVFTCLLLTMMIPGQITMIPVFVTMKTLGWVNTFLPLIVPSFLGGAFGIFLMRQFFMSMPAALEEAARIDGCSRLRVMFQIYFPLSTAALATLGVFTFMGKWNDLLGPVIYLNDFDKMTLTVGLSIFKQQYNTQYNLLMCGAVISVVPIVAIYLCAQKYFVQGIVMSGIKG